MEAKLIAIFNAEKKHSVRYDLFRIDNPEKNVGSIYWPKDAGKMPDIIEVTTAK
jgi:hypothetical protein